ncbi:MAG TPA: DUF883 domain-containing protein [Caulobacteraceae bacterium]|jgi:ElaB/YqjD/DUF883 family membrane-anchored ribosome-binding protein|nr:DUF883 domain-containing protein [Caulobacteraceae bacterium]
MAAQSKTADATTNGLSEEERRIRDFALRAEQSVRERAGELREKARAYYDDASDHIETAQRYVTERVQEKPLASTLTAVGIGVVIGLLLAGGRR